MDRSDLVHLRESGYIRYHQRNLTAIMDVGEIGPKHIPAHAHADTLSYELSLGGKRIVVDSGTSCYAMNHDRMYQRSTAAHNTVEMDGSDSSEVWGVFRVARRARPKGLEISEDSGSLTVRCAHDGYKRLHGRPEHLREFNLTDRSITLTDFIEGKGRHVAKGFLHFHPCVHLRSNTDDPLSFDLSMNGQLFGIVHVEMWDRVELEPSTYSPEFGIRQPNQKLVCLWAGVVPFQGKIKIEFGASPS
ncbi:MAG: heparinase II/III-family protein [Candidatus Latescibacteria bacterium]|nr:heparinase II/III-family protein [Candidatus Latescibacterota bacterium]